MDIVQYSLAPCCNPIPGDDVFGFVSTHEGIKIHRVNCPNATELLSKHGHRVVKAKWTSQTEVSFLAGLKIRGTDRVGMMNDVTRIISSELKVNMRSVSIESDNGIFEGSIQLYVQDTQHLEKLVKRSLKRLKESKKLRGLIFTNYYLPLAIDYFEKLKQFITLYLIFLRARKYKISITK